MTVFMNMLYFINQDADLPEDDIMRLWNDFQSEFGSIDVTVRGADNELQFLQLVKRYNK